MSTTQLPPRSFRYTPRHRRSGPPSRPQLHVGTRLGRFALVGAVVVVLVVVLSVLTVWSS